MFLIKLKKYLIFVFILSVIFYVVFQFKIFFVKQDIFLNSFEKTNNLITNKNFFILEGEVLDSKKFTINSEPVLLNKEYKFSKKLYLSDFQNTFILKSVSKTNVESERIIEIFKN